MSEEAPQQSAAIRVGIGGWTFEPWRNNFYPADLPHSRELEYASRKLTAIEINGTYYSSQKPETFAKWRDETPDGFVFSLKASRFATNRRVLGEAGESVDRFVNSGIAELGPKLGPIVWQFAPTKKFDPVDFEAFLKLLPADVGGRPLRHVMDVRHETFKAPEYLALTPEALDQLAACGQAWRDGGEPVDVPKVESQPAPADAPRDVFMFFISGAKEKAPHAAMALRERIERIGG
jgi:hypothetical protein